MSVYLFEPQKDKPERVNLYDPSGTLVAWIPMDAAVVIQLMYRNGLKHHGKVQANEFMYGYVLGMTHAMLYADQLPKITVTRDGNAIRLMATDGDVVIQPLTDINDVPGKDSHALDQLKRTGVDPFSGKKQ